MISVNSSLIKGEYISSGSHRGKEDSQVFIDSSIGSPGLFMRESGQRGRQEKCVTGEGVQTPF